MVHARSSAIVREGVACAARSALDQPTYVAHVSSPRRLLVMNFDSLAVTSSSDGKLGGKPVSSRMVSFLLGIPSLLKTSWSHIGAVGQTAKITIPM